MPQEVHMLKVNIQIFLPVQTWLARPALADIPAQPIVSQEDYQISQGLADKALVTFECRTPHCQQQWFSDDSQTILSVLSGLVTFTAVDNPAPYNIVEDIMASPIDRDMEKAYQTS